VQLEVTRVSIAKLVADGVAIHPVEAARIVERIWNLTACHGGAHRPVPALQDLKLDHRGRISVANGHERRSVPGAAGAPPADPAESLRQLGNALHLLLSAAGSSPSTCGAGHLWIAADIAVGHPLGRPDLTVSAAGFHPFESVQDFLRAIEPAGSSPADAVLADLFSRWQAKSAPREAARDAPPAAQAPLPLAIAVLRQLREDGGKTLDRIAESTKIPVRRLEQLERGDFSSWPAGLLGRAYVRSYAEEVGFDPAELLALIESHLPPPESIQRIKAVRAARTMRGREFARAAAAALMRRAEWRRAAPSARAVAVVGLIAAVAVVGAFLLVMMLWRIGSGPSTASPRPAGTNAPAEIGTSGKSRN
jgi:hypothetical protein